MPDSTQSSLIGFKGFSLSDPTSWLPAYGNWGGAGWSAGTRESVITQEQIDTVGGQITQGADGQERQSPVDLIFKDHDISYQNAENQSNEASLKLQADLKLMQDIAGLDWSNLNGQEETFAFIAATTFATKIGTVDLIDNAIEGIRDAAKALLNLISSEAGDPHGANFTASDMPTRDVQEIPA